jgi:hypothetical protein
MINKKKKTMISLSKSRSNTSQSSQQSQPLITKIEKLKVKTEDSVCHIEDFENINAKMDVVDTAVAETQLVTEQRDLKTTINRRKEACLALVKDELVKEEPIKDKMDVPVKEEPIEREKDDLPIIEDTLMKEEIKAETEDASIKEDIKGEMFMKNETVDFYLPNDDASTPLLQEYTCPICNHDLTRVKSSYMRQSHVESCISKQSAFAKEEELEFDCCVFCGKNLSRFKSNQRQYHLNNCLDDVQQIEEAEAAAIRKEKDEMFAGQRVPFLSTLDLCPVCHEFDPFTNRNLKQKMNHIKQCAKQNRLSLNQLLKKFQWIGWGHLPVATITPSAPPLSNDIPKTVNIPDHQLVAYVQDMYDGDDDGDFTQNVIIHKTRTIQSTAKEDKTDEELQTALALSRSVLQQQAKRKQRLRPSDERDWNAANIWCIEESRLKAIAKLDELLFSGPQDKSEPRIEETLLGPSRLYIPSVNDQFYCNLTSNKDSNWDNSSTFISLFIHDLHKEKIK